MCPGGLICSTNWLASLPGGKLDLEQKYRLTLLLPRVVGQGECNVGS